MKRLIIIFSIMVVGTMGLTAQEMAAEPQATLTNFVSITMEPSKAADLLPTSTLNTPAVRTVTPLQQGRFSPFNDKGYSAQPLYTPSQSGYASYGGGNSTPSNSIGGTTNGHAVMAAPSFQSTSVLLPKKDKDRDDEIEENLNNEPLVQRVGWGPGSMPADPFLPVGKTPWGLMGLLMGVYVWWRKR